jgi:hypothetical protein
MLAAAALTVAAGGASAQSMLKAEIPFTFRAQGVLMAPGSYTVTINHGSGSTMFVLYSIEDRRSVAIANYSPGDAPKAWRLSGNPTLGFECAGHNCMLRTLWPADDRTAYRLFGPSPTGDEPVRVAEIRLTTAKGSD